MVWIFAFINCLRHWKLFNHSWERVGSYRVTPHLPFPTGHRDCRAEAREVPVLTVTSTATYTKMSIAHSPAVGAKHFQFEF